MTLDMADISLCRRLVDSQDGFQEVCDKDRKQIKQSPWNGSSGNWRK